MSKENQKLVKSNNAQLTTSDSSPPKSSESMLVRMLDLAEKLTGYEAGSGEGRIWSKAFSQESPKAIEWAFHAYFAEPREKTFFPKPGEIKTYVERYHDMQAERDADARQAEYLKEIREAQASGDAVGIAEVMKTWVDRLAARKKV